MNEKLPNLLRSLLKGFEESASLPPAEVEAQRFEKLAQLAQFCNTHSAYFAKRLKEANLTPSTFATPQGLRQLPVMTRRMLQSASNDLFCQKIPKGHVGTTELKTSGSTGEPVTVRRTAANQVYFLALGMMEHIWHKTDFSGRLCVIRPLIKSYSPRDNWGQPSTLFTNTGPMLGLPVTVDVSQLVTWMAGFQPTQLLLLPNILSAITAYCRQFDVALPALSHIRTVSETLLPSVRQDAQTLFHSKVTDVYSSQEMGMIALQCPDSDLYHTVVPNCWVEVIRDDGQPCAVGEVGRVIVTDLNNFATPLIRYDIGDYAEVGPPCPCGRSWPTLKRILGRERNLMVLPNGTRHWPLTGFDRYRELAPIQQFQFVQQERTKMEVRLVVERPLYESEEHALRQHMQESLGFPHDIAFQYFDQPLPRNPSGKFEEFLCLTD